MLFKGCVGSFPGGGGLGGRSPLPPAARAGGTIWIKSWLPGSAMWKLEHNFPRPQQNTGSHRPTSPPERSQTRTTSRTRTAKAKAKLATMTSRTATLRAATPRPLTRARPKRAGGARHRTLIRAPRWPTRRSCGSPPWSPGACAAPRCLEGGVDWPGRVKRRGSCSTHARARVCVFVLCEAENGTQGMDQGQHLSTRHLPARRAAPHAPAHAGKRLNMRTPAPCAYRPAIHTFPMQLRLGSLLRAHGTAL